MKTYLLRIAIFVVWGVTGIKPVSGQIRPRYVPTQIVLVLDEDLAATTEAGKSPPDLFQAMDATATTTSSFVPGVYTVHLPPNSRFGRAYAIAQAFDFGPRWYIRALDANYIAQLNPGVREDPVVEDGAVRVFSLSVRADVRPGEGATIGGIVVPGNFAQLVVFRVRGPSLTPLGIAQALPNPVLRLYEGSKLILQNDNWGTLRDFEKMMARRACAPPDHPLDAMLGTYLDPGVSYTAIVSGAGGETGIAIAEVFILDEFYISSNAR